MLADQIHRAFFVFFANSFAVVITIFWKLFGLPLCSNNNFLKSSSGFLYEFIHVRAKNDNAMMSDGLRARRD